MARILITTDYLTPGDDVDRLLHQHGHDPIYAPHTGPRTPAEQRDLLQGIDGAILASEPITAEMLTTADMLQVIARSGVGYDSIDVPAATARGIRVCNAPGTNHHSVAELTLGLIIMASRHLAEITTATRQGRWPRRPGHELRDATLGVIGYGPSGRAITALGTALGMNVMVHTAHPDLTSGIQFTDLNTVITRADYLTLHTRADRTSHHLIDTDRLKMMKSTAVLINTARGALIDEHALAWALNSGVIAAAALDVLETEPLLEHSPLRQANNAVITSHMAGQTIEARNRAGLAAAHAVIDVLNGHEPTHLVNR